MPRSSPASSTSRWLVGFVVLVSLSAGLGALSKSFPDAPLPPAMNGSPQAPSNQPPRTPPPAMDQSGSSSALS
jgi:hypothetical protein